MTVPPEEDSREPADPGYERDARRLFPIGEMEPERYVALYGHGWLAGTIFTVRYEEPEMDAWISRAGALLFDFKSRDALEREWLSPEEYEQVQRRYAQQMDGDL
ncbi:MAG TPA: hypothetical protein VIM33_07450 [Gaiellaceae bacterium]|jgi:hypothetical protein